MKTRLCFSLLCVLALVFICSPSLISVAEGKHQLEEIPILKLVGRFQIGSNKKMKPGDAGDFLGVTVRNHIAYIAASYEGLWIVDLKDLEKPIILSKTPLVDQSMDLILQDNLVYIVHGTGGFSIVDISNPYSPTILSTMELQGRAEVIALQGHYAYITTSWYVDGMEIVDIQDPFQPQSVSFTSISGYGYSIAVDENYAYVSGAGYTMEVFDISNPLIPKKTDTLGIPGYGSGTTIAGSYILHAWYKDATFGGGLHILDITQPSEPTIVAISETPGGGRDVVSAGWYAFFADGTSGLRVFDISDPQFPFATEVYDTVGIASDLALSDGYLYLASGVGGLYIFELNAGYIEGAFNDLQDNPVDKPVLCHPLLKCIPNATGNFKLDNLIYGTYTIKPSLEGFTFWPHEQTATIPPNTRLNIFYLLPSPVSATLSLENPTLITFTDTQGLITTLTFPAGAAATPVTVTVTPIVPDKKTGSISTNHAFSIKVTNGGINLPFFSFLLPIDVEIVFSDIDVRLVSDATQHTLWFESGGTWLEANQTCSPPEEVILDIENKSISTSVCETGNYGTFGPTHTINLPVINR